VWPGGAEYVARLVDVLVPVGEGEVHAAFEDVARVPALAAIVGEPDKQRRHIGVRRIRLETDRVWPEVLEMTLVPFDLYRLGSTRLRRFRHLGFSFPDSNYWAVVTDLFGQLAHQPGRVREAPVADEPPVRDAKDLRRLGRVLLLSQETKPIPKRASQT
jgi:hypothetical protein